MATLNINEHIGGYWVKALIKSNAYTETYRVEDANSHPYFLKLFLIKKPTLTAPRQREQGGERDKLFFTSGPAEYSQLYQ